MKRALVLTLLMAAVLIVTSGDLFASSRKAASKRTPPSDAFSKLDKNSDGFLSRAEFEKSRPAVRKTKAKAAPAPRKAVTARRKAAAKSARLAPRSARPAARRRQASRRRQMSTGSAKAFGRPARRQGRPRSRAGRAHRGVPNIERKPRMQARPARGRGPLAPTGPATMRHRRGGGSGDIKKPGSVARPRRINRQRSSAWQPWMGRRGGQRNSLRRSAPSVERRAPARTPVRRPRRPQAPARRPDHLGGQTSPDVEPTPGIASDQDVIDNWQLLAELGLVDRRNL